MLTPLEVFFVLLLVFIAFAVVIAFIAALNGWIAPNVFLNASNCSTQSVQSVATMSTLSARRNAALSRNGINNTNNANSGIMASSRGGVSPQAQFPRPPQRISTSARMAAPFLLRNNTTTMTTQQQPVVSDEENGFVIDPSARLPVAPLQSSTQNSGSNSSSSSAAMAGVADFLSNDLSTDLLCGDKSSTLLSSDRTNAGISKRVVSFSTPTATPLLQTSVHNTPMEPVRRPIPTTTAATSSNNKFSLASSKTIKSIPLHRPVPHAPVYNAVPICATKSTSTLSSSYNSAQQQQIATLQSLIETSYSQQRQQQQLRQQGSLTEDDNGELTPAAPLSVSTSTTPGSMTNFSGMTGTLTPWQKCDQKLAILIDGDVQQQLKGSTVRDMANMTRYLMDYMHIQPHDIYLLTSTSPTILLQHLTQGTNGKEVTNITDNTGYVHDEQEARFSKINVATTTPDNVRNILRTLVHRCKEFAKHSFVFFHYSGHGMLNPPSTVFSTGPAVSSVNTNEMAHIPQTSIQVGPNVYLTNTELYELFVMRLPRRVRLFALVDACNSGVALALPYSYNVESKQWNTTSFELFNQKGQHSYETNQESMVLSLSKRPECEVTAIGASSTKEPSQQVQGSIIGYGGALTVAFLESGTITSNIDRPIEIIHILNTKLQSMQQHPQLQAGFPIPD